MSKQTRAFVDSQKAMAEEMSEMRIAHTSHEVVLDMMDRLERFEKRLGGNSSEARGSGLFRSASADAVAGSAARPAGPATTAVEVPTSRWLFGPEDEIPEKHPAIAAPAISCAGCKLDGCATN